jgi:hypothetical protein
VESCGLEQRGRTIASSGAGAAEFGRPRHGRRAGPLMRDVRPLPVRRCNLQGMKSRIPAIALLLLFVPGSVCAQSIARRPPPDSADVDTLFGAVDMVDLLTGYAPAPTIHSRWLRAIACSSNAVDEFNRLYPLASPEGKVLLLIGMRHVGSANYHGLRDEFAVSRVPARKTYYGNSEIGEDVFDVMNGGCSPERMSKAEVLRQLDNGTLEKVISWDCRDASEQWRAPEPAQWSLTVPVTVRVPAR